MTDDELDRVGPAFIWGLLWSAISIAGPAALFSLGVLPTIMLGAIVGAVVRVGTDMGVLFFGENRLSHPVTLLMVILQFGTLFTGGIAAWLGDMRGVGVVGIMLLTYLVGLAISSYYTDGADDEPDSEWTYDIDDV